MNTSSILDSFIREESVARIFDSAGWPSDGDSRMNAHVKHLQWVYAAAFGQHAAASRKERTDLTARLSELLYAVRTLQQAFRWEAFETIGKPLELSALSLFSKQKSMWNSSSEEERAGNTKPVYRSALSTQNILEGELANLDGILRHFFAMVDKFDAIASHDQINWFFQGKDEQEKYIHQSLFPYLRKGSGTGPDTDVLLQIAAMYEHAYQKPFTVTKQAGKTKYENARGEADLNSSKIKLPAYSGRGVDFAHAIIVELKISNLFLPHKDLSKVSQYRPTHAPTVDATQYDLAESNRAAALFGADDSIALINKIGDLWHNHQKKERYQQNPRKFSAKKAKSASKIPPNKKSLRRR